MSLPSDEKRHYVAVMPHTLHAVRAAGHRIEFYAECALAERASVQKLLQDWSEGLPVAATVAVSPEPVWWHLRDSAESRSLRSDDEVRRFAARLPHGMRGALEVIGCDAASGMPVSAGRETRWLLGVTTGDALAVAATDPVERGIVAAELGSATLACVAAAKTVAQLGKTGAVRLWAPGETESYVFTVGIHGIEVVGRCAIGYETLFAAVQQVSGAKSRDDAARWFFNAAPPDPVAVDRVIAIVAPQLDSVLAASALSGPASMACAGFTGSETWFGQAMARALGLPYWAPQLEHYLNHLGVTVAPDSHASPSLNLLGLLHLAAAHAHGRAAWHPSWGSIFQAAAVPVGSPQPRVAQPQALAAASSPLPAMSAQPSPAPDALHFPPASDPAQMPRTPALAPAAATAVATNGVSHVNSFNPETATSAVSPDQEVPSSQSYPPLTAPTSTTPTVTARTLPTHPEPNGAGKKTNPLAATTPIAARPPDLGSPPSPHRREPSESRRSYSLPSDKAGRAPARATASPGAELWDEPPPPPIQAEPASREPVVILVRKRGYWPHAAIIAAILGAGIAAKFYLDADAVRTAAAREKRLAEEATEKAEREVAAAVQQVRFASQQAALADQRAREVAAATAKEVERVRTETEAARVKATAQARRESDEHTRELIAREFAAARAATLPGILKIASAPSGADVSVDGRPAQRAPATIEGLSPGPHAVVVTLAGHVPLELNATIVGSKTTDLGAIKLERATGAVDLSSEPAALDFSIRSSNTPVDADPLRRGRTPARLTDLPVGEYVVEFNRAGWPERTERVKIERGATARVTTKFQGGTVTINSSPTGATVIEGGLLLGKTPLTLGDVPPHDVTYELTVPGFEPLKVNGAVVAGRELELNGTLLDLNRLTTVEEIRTPPRPYLTTPVDVGRVPRSTPPYVTVSLIVRRNGSVEDVRVVEPVDKKLSKRFIETIGKWIYYPGVSHAGYPVNVRMSVPIKVSRG